ncbi:DUF2325 domain-containing protein [Sterolibacterium denitrificans]|nr:DUF2325 domain-containing protein [Sterolibacterium denitrificans]
MLANSASNTGDILAPLRPADGLTSAVRDLRDAGVRMKPFSLALGQAFSGEEAPDDGSVGQPLRRQRRKIWEMPHPWHCTLIGTCLTVSDLRHLMKFGDQDVPVVGDYGLHSYIVNHCDARNEITDEIHRMLNQRYAQAVRSFSKVMGSDAVLAAWKREFVAGNIAGSLWAAWTHGDVGEYEGMVIYGDLHMLSHQLCAEAQPSQIRIGELEKENHLQVGELARLRQELASMRNGRAQRITELEGRVAELEGKLDGARKAEAAWMAAGDALGQNQALRERNELLNQRLSTLEQRNHAQQGRLVELGNEIARMRNAAPRKGDGATEEEVVDPADDIVTTHVLPDKANGLHLDGRRILCIGGRPGVIDHYRRLVESSGGSFIHHDGGQEDNEHRIDAIVASADIVFCQVGYVSHPSYWRIKEACKQRGLPCVFQKSGGVTGFARDLALVFEDARVRRLPQASSRMLFAPSGEH